MNFYNPSAAQPAPALVVPPVHERQLPRKSQETTATNPWPLALLAQNLKNYVDKVPELWVEAQVASLNGRGGNVFMELKDLNEDFSFTLALFGRAGSGLAADVTVGARIVTRAKPSLWKNGKLSLIGKEVYAVGTGNLHEQLQRLREALAAEGLFSDARKKPLPMLPNRVGLITGRDSDAEKDVIRNASLRWPGVVFEVRNTRVQGEGAAAEVIAALAELDAHPEVDVIVIARGGGSFEDLLPFSEEALIRAVAAATTPVVSAIGHEADSPILDAVADLRASTPTDAGKRIVPDISEETARITEARARLDRAVLGYVGMQMNYIAQLRSRPVLTHPESSLLMRVEELSQLRERAHRSVQHRLERESATLSHTLARVRSLSPAQTLNRGYSIVQDAAGAIVRDASALSEGEQITVRAATGSAQAAVTSTDPSNIS
ncbi:MAG: exodeoxyribonuclease VII large subunit [Rothia mucilaginosa]|uniref:Exodeoxyribonuclease 7 large subunit n=1 Tax=Rothia mucilaginosa TaxID=43675 RepID=A0A930PTH8_9MICC|nr:exodeoxyribonuclease VII large subunit [Rothia mucilaginosa]MBF1658653.1 exodeoxyribonuclease VII large subunit [Rothia mucilaginosa]